MNRQNKKKQIICLCNDVAKDEIEKAILKGCNTLDLIFDATTAGVGPCGGSCRPKLMTILTSYKTTGKFPETIHDPKHEQRRQYKLKRST